MRRADERGWTGADGVDPWLVVDGHNDLAWALRLGAGSDVRTFGRTGQSGLALETVTTLARLRAGRVGGQFWSVYVPSNLPDHEAVTQTLEQVDAVHRLVEAYPDDLVLATSAAEVRAAWEGGRIASLLGAEGGQSIGSSLGALRMLHRLGVRYLTLTHNDNAPWAGSATDVPVPGGLTTFGVDVVREMNRLGMLVDLSHVSVDTMWAALSASQAPVIFSHSSARAITDVVRNVPDDVLGAMARAGGVCMVTFVPEFVNDEVAAWRRMAATAAAADGVSDSDHVGYSAWVASYVTTHPKPPASLEDVVRHVQHVREVAGVEHVGLGGDYDGTDSMPVGLEDVSSYPRLLHALADRGWSGADLAGLARGNVLRVLRDVEGVARDLRARRDPSLATIAGQGIPEGSVTSSEARTSADRRGGRR